MAGNIGELCRAIQTTETSTSAEKLKAKETCDMLTTQGLETLQVNADARDEALTLLKEVDLTPTRTVNALKRQLNAGEVQKTTTKQNGQTKEIVKNNSGSYEYFGLKSDGELSKDMSKLGLDLASMLGGYQSFIESRLTGLDPAIKEKIKKSIFIKTASITTYITDLKDEKKDGVDFTNYRWLVNEKMHELFININTKVLPSAYIIARGDDSIGKSSKFKEKLERTKQMFESELTDKGDFDKSFWSKAGFGEVLDSSTNNWEVFDITDSKDLKKAKSMGFKEDELSQIDLLNEEDKKVQKRASIAYMACLGALLTNDIASFTGVWTIPGAVIGGAYGLTDSVTDNDVIISLLQQSGYIPEEYIGKNKIFWDRVLAFAGAFPLVGQGLRIAKNSERVASFVAKLKSEDVTLFNQIKVEMGEKMKEMFSWGKEVKSTTENFGVPLSKVKSLKTGETINKNFLLDGKKVTVIFKKGHDGSLKIYKVIDLDGNEKVGVKAMKFIDGKKLQELSIMATGAKLVENREIGKKLDEMKEGEKIKFGGIEYTKKEGKFTATENGKNLELTTSQMKKRADSITLAEKSDLTLELKRQSYLKRFAGKKAEVNGHEVRIKDDGSGYEIWKKGKAGNIKLTDEETKAFLSNNKNIANLKTHFDGYFDVIKGGKYLKNKADTIGNHTWSQWIRNYLDKAGYIGGTRSNFLSTKFFDALGGVALTPATFARQIVPAIKKAWSLDPKNWDDLARLTISGNKNVKVWGESGEKMGQFARIGNSGITRGIGLSAGMMYLDDDNGGPIPYVDLGKDKDLTFWDEVGDLALYNNIGIIWTTVAKRLGWID